MSRLVGVVVVALLAVVPSAQAAIGIQVDQKVVVVGASLHVTAFGPAGTAGMPVYLAPASIDFTTHPCGANSVCFPSSDGPPSAPYVRIGHLPQSIDIFHTRRMSFRVPALRTGAYRVVVYCELCVAGTAGSLIASPQTVRIASASGTAKSRCGAPSSAAQVPTGTVGDGLHVGPIWFVGSSSVTISGYPDAMVPTKVLIQAPHPPLKTDLTLRGFECATGRLLRFWYSTYGQPSSPVDHVPVTSDELRQNGTKVAVLHRFGQAGVTVPGGQRTDYRGYILFAAPGDWKITVRQGKIIIGSVVYRVTTAS